jgi:hypothetical protein
MVAAKPAPELRCVSRAVAHCVSRLRSQCASPGDRRCRQGRGGWSRQRSPSWDQGAGTRRLPHWPASDAGGRPASARGRAPGLAGALEAPGPVNEDAADDRRVGDDGDDAHTPRARERIGLVDAPQQLRAAVAARTDQFTGSAIATGSWDAAPSAAVSATQRLWRNAKGRSAAADEEPEHAGASVA